MGSDNFSAVVCLSDQSERVALARALAMRWSVPMREAIVSPEQGDQRPVLVVLDDRLGLADPAQPKQKPVCVDLDDRLETANALRGQPLGRALGKGSRQVVDATAGLGRDAAMIAAMEHDVLGIEQSPVLCAMLEDGVQRATRHDDPRVRDLAGRITLRQGDACGLLVDMHPPPDVVYLDPMFPMKRKASALARKDVRLVRALVSDDMHGNDTALLDAARRVARKRVVVKRADDAPPLAGSTPSMAIRGKLVRYDVYVTDAR